MMSSRLTAGGGGCRILATLARVVTARLGLLWYNTNCAQKPPHAYVQVTLARGTGPECGAACVVSNSKTHAAVGLAAIATWVSVAWGRV